MTDRLSLTKAPAGTNIDRQKAKRIATEIFDAIHDNNVATKQDLQVLRTELEGKIRHQLLTRLGGPIVAVATPLFVPLHYWPPRP